MTPILAIQSGVFYEDQTQDTGSIIRQYFPEAVSVTDAEVVLGSSWATTPLFGGPFRGSLTLASRLHRRFPYANAQNWAPTFRKEIVSKDYIILDAASILERGYLDQPKFIKPCMGTKVFSGNVFSRNSFETEFQFMTVNRNISPTTLCLVASPIVLGREWRLIFVNNRFSSSSQYMDEGHLHVTNATPPAVIQFGERISTTPYFTNIFDFVLDIAETPDGLGLVEINAFETSSFYAADLDKVYKDWATELQIIQE